MATPTTINNSGHAATSLIEMKNALYAAGLTIKHIDGTPTVVPINGVSQVILAPRLMPETV